MKWVKGKIQEGQSLKSKSLYLAVLLNGGIQLQDKKVKSEMSRKAQNPKKEWKDAKSQVDKYLKQKKENR